MRDVVSRGDVMCKGPGAGVGLTCSRQGRNRGGGDDLRVVARGLQKKPDHGGQVSDRRALACV